MFKNRKEAGELLAAEINERGYKAPIIFALARGGVPIGFEVAQKLKAPLEVIVVQKLSDQVFPELGFGAIAPEGVLVVDNTIIDELGIDHNEIESIKLRAEKELLRRIKHYNAKIDFGDLSKNTAILVDDGIATGISTKAAARFLRKFSPQRIVLAVPVCPSQVINVLKKEFDEVVCLDEEIYLLGVSQFYKEFPQVSDKEVKDLLKNK